MPCRLALPSASTATSSDCQNSSKPWASAFAFGLAGGAGAGLVLVTTAALAVIGYLFARNPQRPGMWIAVGLLAGGAIGNLADRVRADAVTDFVAVGSWPPFNLADVSITLGVLLLVYFYLRDAEREEEPQAEAGRG